MALWVKIQVNVNTSHFNEGCYVFSPEKNQKRKKGKRFTHYRKLAQLYKLNGW